jgi:hypothetical protein
MYKIRTKIPSMYYITVNLDYCTHAIIGSIIDKPLYTYNH